MAETSNEAEHVVGSQAALVSEPSANIYYRGDPGQVSQSICVSIFSSTEGGPHRVVVSIKQVNIHRCLELSLASGIIYMLNIE